MPTNVGTTTLVVRAFMGDFKKDVAREAGPAGDAAADKFGKAFKAKVGLALAGAFAAATKSALDLDNALRSTAASAGIAETEMEGFKTQVLELFSANPSKSFAEIASTIGALKTDLGLSTEAAGEAAQAFLDFSKVTGQDGTSAVKALDDILDAFNLDASESGRVMDLLVASHQKYGGSVTENQTALKTLAPALQAMNLSVDDGAALLNLFATTGLDASKATFALNTAVKKLKPGQSLDDLIEQLAAIEDPTLRAQEAIKIFGARGGVALANALKPGVKGLGDFKVAAGDAAGATTKAADKIDDSFQNKIKSAFRTFIEGPLASLGPAVTTAISTLATLTTALIGMGVTLDVLKAKAVATWAALSTGAIAAVPGVALLVGAIDRSTSTWDEATRAWAWAQQQMDEANNAAVRLTAAIAASDADLGQFEANIDGIGIAVGAAATDVDDAAGLMVDDMVGLAADATGANYRTSFSIKGIGGAATASKEELDAAMEAMLQKLIDSRDPVKQAAEAYGKAIKDPIDISDRIELLEQMIVAVAPDLESEAPNVRAAAQLYINAARDEITLLTSQMYGYGTGAASAWLRGFAGQIHRQVGDVNVALDEIRSLTQGQSPPEKGPLKDIDKGGFATGKAWVEGFVGGLAGGPQMAAAPLLAATPLAYAAAGSSSAPRVNAAPAASRGAINVNVYNPAPEPASQSVDERLRILAATGII